MQQTITRPRGYYTQYVTAARCGSAFRVRASPEHDSDLDGYSPDEQAYRPVRTQLETHSLRNIFSLIEEGDLCLQPKYQREYVWDKDKACRLIETVFCGLFIPAVTWHEKDVGRFDVVDGRQRLTTLYSFYKGVWPGTNEPFRISGASIHNLNGKQWQDLPHEGEVSQRMYLKFALPVAKLLQGTPEEAVFRTYENLNSGSISLTTHQVRKAVYPGGYVELLDRLARHELMLQVRGAEGPSQFEEDREMVLRFFALKSSGLQGFRGPLKEFMNREMSKHQHIMEHEQRQLEQVFIRTLELVVYLYGPEVFRKKESKKGTMSKMNLHLWDTLMGTLSTVDDIDRQALRANKDKLRLDMADMVGSSPVFTQARLTRKNLAEREAEYARRLALIISGQGPSPTDAYEGAVPRAQLQTVTS